MLRAEESYRRAHEWLQSAFAKINVLTEIAPGCEKSTPGQCFLGHEKYDLLWQGRKIAGAAQRRTRAGLLIQGSLQPPPLGLRRVDWESAMNAARSGSWESFQPDAAMRERSERLVAQKYSQADFLKKR
jgi:lipoate-protein ligase A